jgi:hypothetical protein
MVARILFSVCASFVLIVGCTGRPAEPTRLEQSALEPGGPSPIDGEWLLTATAAGDDLAVRELVYDFDAGRASVLERGTALGDGFVYSADERSVKISGGEEEGILDTGPLFEDVRFDHYNYTVDGDSMTWWIHSQNSRGREGRKAIYVFMRVGSVESAAPAVVTLAEADDEQPLDGRWRLKRALGTPIPKMAFDMVYTFDGGRGSFEKNGKSSGDGFRYVAASGRITLDGAGDEGLLDAGQDSRHYSHYNYTISGREMSWWIHDSFSPADRKILYVFERTG